MYGVGMLGGCREFSWGLDTPVLLHKMLRHGLHGSGDGAAAEDFWKSGHSTTMSWIPRDAEASEGEEQRHPLWDFASIPVYLSHLSQMLRPFRHAERL